MNNNNTDISLKCEHEYKLKEIQKENNITIKKRGRPRKKMINNSSIIKLTEKKMTEQSTNDKELILHLPIYLSKEKTKIEKKPDTDIITKWINKNNENNITNDNDNDNIDSISKSDENLHDKIHILEIQLKKKDKFINKLKDELASHRMSDNLTPNNLSNEIKYHLLNCRLIDNSNGKTIIAEKTNIACWWCTYNFDSLPCFIPERYDGDKFYVFGCFCSFNCACAYNLNMNDYKTKDRYSLIKLMANIINIPNDIYLAPQKEVLEKYGGPLSIIKYRENFIKCTKQYKLIQINLVPIDMVIEEKKNGT